MFDKAGLHVNTKARGLICYFTEIAMISERFAKNKQYYQAEGLD